MAVIDAGKERGWQRERRRWGRRIAVAWWTVSLLVGAFDARVLATRARLLTPLVEGFEAAARNDWYIRAGFFLFFYILTFPILPLSKI